MGFSLRRALAGAVAGGAGAAVELADNAIKAAEHDRQQEQAFERQKELLRIHDENASNREQRSFEFKEKHAAKKIERYSAFLSATTAELKKEGVKPESADGQARIAAALSSNGFPAEGDKYQDNYFKLLELKSKDARAEAEQGIRLEMARDRRSGTVDKSSAKEAEKRLQDTIDGFAFKVKDRDGKFVDDNDARNLVASIADKGRRSGKSADEMNSTLLALMPAFDAERREKPGANGADIFRLTWEKANHKQPDQAPAQALPVTTQPTAQKKVTPSIFNSGSSSHGASGSWDSPPVQRKSAAGIPVSDTPSRVGTLPMSRNFGDDVADFATQGASTLTGSGANLDQMNRDISKPRNSR